MTRDPVTVTPHTSVLNARRLLQGNGIRHLPVVSDGRLVGIVSDRDVLLRDGTITQALSALQSDLVTGRYRSVGKVMSAPVHVAECREPVAAAAERMLRHHISALPVVEDTRLVGIITTTDCLRAVLSLDAASPTVREEGSCPGDPDFYKTVAIDAGDERPGRPAPDLGADDGTAPDAAPVDANAQREAAGVGR